MTFPDDEVDRAPEGASGADQTDTAPAGNDALEASLAEARAQAEQARDQLLRTVAELDNVRKRSARDIEQARRFALERFAGELIGVKDSLEMALAAKQGAAAQAEAVLAGVEATLKLLTRAFEKEGLTEIVPAGQPFNPELHEAMVTQPSADQPPDTVLEVIQKGYLLNGRLLRPARVIVARAP